MVKTIKFRITHGNVIRVSHKYYEFIGSDFVVKRIVYNESSNIRIDNTLKELVEEGFIYLYDRRTKKSIDLTIDNIKDNYYDESLNFFVAQKFFKSKEIEEFVEFIITIQFKNTIINSFYTLVEDDEKTLNHEFVTFTAYTSMNNSLSEAQKKEIAEMDRLFGEHYNTNNWHQSDQWRNPYEYRVHVSKIEKIILTKYFKDIDSIGTERQGLRNGETEVLELDLRNPDMEIYEKMRAIDNCIEVNWE